MTRVWERRATRRPPAGGGFTLVEVIVTLGVAALLLAIAAPLVVAARRGGTASVCLSHLRECQRVLSLYQGDWDDFFPAQGRPTLTGDAFDNAGLSLPFFTQSLHWPNASRRYFDSEDPAVTRCPATLALLAGDEDDPLPHVGYMPTSDYRLGHTMYTAPRRWRADADFDDASLLTAVRASSVRFPSDKGAFIEAAAFHDMRPDEQYGGWPERYVPGEPEATARRHHVGFADGSSHRVRGDTLLPGLTLEMSRPGQPVMTTPDGAHGRDR